MTLIFIVDDVKNDVGSCTYKTIHAYQIGTSAYATTDTDVKMINVKNRTAVAGSVGFLKLELKLFKEKCVHLKQFLL